MKKRIFLGLALVLFIFLAGSIIAAVTITKTADIVDRLVLLHQVEIGRESLIIHLQQVQTNLYRSKQQRNVDVDLLIARVQEVDKSLNTCLGCHHSPELTQALRNVRNLFQDYKAAISQLVTVSANPRRAAAIETRAFERGQELIAMTQGMAFSANIRLRQRTQETMAAMHTIRNVLFAMLGAGFVIALVIAYGLARSVDRPLLLLLDATRRIARGDLQHRVDPFAVRESEFRELAGALNAMAADLQRSQRQLCQSVKLAAVGELATNIAYEVNSPLTAVLGYAGLLLKADEIPPVRKEHLRTIEHEALRAREIVKNLLDFSRRRPPHQVMMDIRHVVEDAVALIRAQARLAGVTVMLECLDGIPTLSIDQEEMQQVFVNLMNNALHAMPGGGTLTLRCRFQRGDEDGGPSWAAVEVVDTGMGIPGAQLDKIFDPFFTTRGEGEGAGLGLSISSLIVHNHGGRIDAESTVGKGSRFTVYLPVP